MELKGKGDEARINAGITELLISLFWTLAADFDLGALIKNAATGAWELIYFQNYGDLNTPPFIKLDKDSGVGGDVAEGGNKETMTITQKGLEAAKRIHLLVWDWDQVKVGGAARFADSDAKITVVDNTGAEHDVKLETGAMGNIACIASLEISPTGAKLVNTSSAGLLKKPFVNTDEVLAVLGLPKD